MTTIVSLSAAEITSGQSVTWSIQTDVEAADAWWIGTNDGVPISSEVPGWYGQDFWQSVYTYNQPAEYTRTVLLFDDNGLLIDESNTVELTIVSPPPPPSIDPRRGSRGVDGGGTGGGTGTGITPVDLSGIPEPFRSILQGILDNAHQTLDIVERDLNGIASAIVGTVGQALTDIIPAAVDVLAGANVALANFTATLANELTPTGEFWDALIARIPDPTQTTETIAADVIAMLVMHIKDQISASIPDDLIAHSEPATIAAILSAAGVALPEPIIAAITAAGASSLGVVGMLAMAAVAFLLIRAFLGPIDEKMRQSANDIIRAELPTPAELAESVQRGFISADDADTYLHKMGFPDDVIGIQRQLTQEQLNTSEYTSLWLRGLVDDDTLNAQLAKFGYQPSDRDHIKQLALLLPSVTDVVRFALRDAFFDDFAEEYGMDESNPYDVAPQYRYLFDQIGLTPETFKFFWRAHWELPSIEQAYRMFWRELIDDKQLDRLLRAHGVEPFWRPKQIDAAYHPLTRIDVRRLRVAGIIDKDEVQRQYQWGGYSPENAAKLADYVEQTAAAQIDQNLAPWRAGFKTHLTTAYENGVIGSEELHEGLTTLGYTDDQVAAFVAQSEFVYTSKLYDIVRAGVKKKYLNGFVDDGEAAQELSGYGVDDAQIERLIAAWGIERDYRDLSNTQTANRELSQTQIVEAYTDRIVNHDDAHALLRHLNYNDDDADTLLSLADVRAVKAQQSAVKGVVQKLYVAGRMDRNDAIARLDAVSVAPDNRDLLLDTWDAERAAKVQALPLSVIELMVRDEIMSVDQAQAQLAEQGYSDTEITQVLALWGVKSAQEKAKLAVAADKARKQLNAEQIKHAYIAGVFDQTSARQRLIDIHYAPEDADVLLRLTPRELTAQQIINALKATTIDRTEATRRLREVGYTEADSALLIRTAIGD